MSEETRRRAPLEIFGVVRSFARSGIIGYGGR